VGALADLLAGFADFAQVRIRQPRTSDPVAGAGAASPMPLRRAEPIARHHFCNGATDLAARAE